LPVSDDNVSSRLFPTARRPRTEPARIIERFNAQVVTTEKVGLETTTDVRNIDKTDFG